MQMVSFIQATVFVAITFACGSRNVSNNTTMNHTDQQEVAVMTPPMVAASETKSEALPTEQAALPVVSQEKQAPKRQLPLSSDAMPPAPNATDSKVAPIADESAPAANLHDGWDQLLRQHVSASGKVNYKALKKEEAALNAYLEALAANPIQADWSRKEKMAYWINAYNAFTVKLILNNYPVSSIMKLHNGNPWDVKWIKLGDKTYSLNQIEHDILRPQFKDARIHFAVNCAAKSCPPLLNRAWTADNLERYFDQQTKAFINNAAYNKISVEEVQLSKIFEWYAADFGELIPYLNKYSTVKIAPTATVKHIEYDWALNE